MKLFGSALFALMGQALDVWTTKLVSERTDSEELNPFMRPWVEQQRWRRLFLFKVLLMAGGLAVAFRSSKNRRDEMRAWCRWCGIFGTLAGLWNIVFMLWRQRHSARCEEEI